MDHSVGGLEAQVLYLAQVDQNLKDLLERMALLRTAFAERIELLHEIAGAPSGSETGGPSAVL
jgi:hypothetical protein